MKRWNASTTIAYSYPSELVWEDLQSHFTCGDLGVAMEEVDLCSQHVREACSPFVDVVMTAAAAELASRATRSSSSSGDGDALSHVQHLRGMFPALEQLGYDIDELLAAGGLRRKDVEDPDAYVSPRNCSLVFTRAQEKRNIKNLALQLVLRTPVNSPLLEYLIVSSDTVEHGLHLVQPPQYGWSECRLLS